MIRFLFLCFFFSFGLSAIAQDSIFNSLEEAMKHPMRVQVLILEKLGLEKIPMTEIGSMPNLKVLKLHKNNIHVMPEELSALSNLEEMILSSNRIKAIPESIGDLTKLKLLNLSGNQIRSLPTHLCSIKFLETLVLHSNELETLPSGLENLEYLKTLDIRGNQLKRLSKKEIKSWFQQSIKVKKSSACNC